MGHFIQGFLARTPGAESLLALIPQSEVRVAGAGLVFLPLMPGDGPLFVGPTKWPCFEQLTVPLAQAATIASAHGTIVYLETEYFGGIGTQAAVSWAERNLLAGPFSPDSEQHPVEGRADWPVNRALQAFELRTGDGDQDGFVQAGLAKYRSNADWLEHGRPA